MRSKNEIEGKYKSLQLQIAEMTDSLEKMKYGSEFRMTILKIRGLEIARDTLKWAANPQIEELVIRVE